MENGKSQFNAQFTILSRHKTMIGKAEDHVKQKAAARAAETKARSGSGSGSGAEPRARVHPEAELRAAEAETELYRERAAAARAIDARRKYPMLDPARLKAARADAMRFRSQSDRDRAAFARYHSAEKNSLLENDVLQYMMAYL
jgi:hypothetical protein